MIRLDHQAHELARFCAELFVGLVIGSGLTAVAMLAVVGVG